MIRHKPHSVFPPWLWESVVQWHSSYCTRQVVPGLLCIVLFVCLFFAFYTRASPPSSGAHWSVKQSKLQSSHSLTASSRPKQAGRPERLLQKFSQVKDHPTVYRLPHSHCGVGDFVLRKLNLKYFFLLLHGID